MRVVKDSTFRYYLRWLLAATLVGQLIAVRDDAPDSAAFSFTAGTLYVVLIVAAFDVVTATVSRAHRAWRRRRPPLPPAPCGCVRCTDARLAASPVWEPRRMIVCAVCGNKRCPHASDHRLSCTGSNEPGQPGSVYR